MVYTVITIVLAIVALVLAFTTRFPAVVPAWLALLVKYLAPASTMPSTFLISWGATAAVAACLFYMLPRQSRLTMPQLYITGAAAVGTLLGYLGHTTASIVLASAVGALLGALAFRLSPAGRAMQGSPVKYFNLVASTTLQSVVTFSLIAIAL